MNEHSNIRELKYGNVRVLEKIYAEYRLPFLNWMVRTHYCDREDALEIYQHAILVFYENVMNGKFDVSTEASIKTYIFSIGKNKMLAERRKQAKFEQIKNATEELIYLEPDLESPNQHKMELAMRAIEQLGNPCKQVLQLFYLNNLDYEEIAVIMDYKNGNTVKNIKYKCIQRIRKLLKNDQDS